MRFSIASINRSCTTAPIKKSAVAGKIGNAQKSKPKKLLVERAKDFALQSLNRRGHPAQSDMLVGDLHVSRVSSGYQIIYFHQHLLGIPIFKSVLAVTCSREDRPLHVTGDFIEITDHHRLYKTTINPVAAAEVAVCHIVGGAKNSGKPLRASVIARFPITCEPTVLAHPSCSAPISCQLIWFPQKSRLRLAWRVILDTKRHGDFDVIVAATGQPKDRVLYCQSTRLCVDASAPIFQPNPGAGASIQKAMPEPIASYPGAPIKPLPVDFPWSWVESNSTAGPNAVAGANHSVKPVLGSAVQARIVFSPKNEVEAAIVNAFYWCNFAHDFFYALGFDEEAGNYQSDRSNMGRLPDPMHAKIFNSASSDFANIKRVTDGTPPSMILTPHPITRRHAALDAEIILHEYTHAVTERLAGGRLSWNPNSTPQGRALGEGFSDYFSLSILNYGVGVQGAKSVFGAWIGNSATNGIRRLPYDGSFAGTFADLGKVGFKEEHDAGQIWADCLFRISRKLGQRVSDDKQGCRMAWRIILDSLPQIAQGTSGPNFLDARDAILKALSQGPKSSDFTGADLAAVRRDLWEVFKSRGMGPKASCMGADLASKGIQADFG